MADKAREQLEAGSTFEWTLGSVNDNPKHVEHDVEEHYGEVVTTQEFNTNTTSLTPRSGDITPMKNALMIDNP